MFQLESYGELSNWIPMGAGTGANVQILNAE